MMDIIACSRKVLTWLIRMSYRLPSEHPFVMGMLFFLFMSYIFLPYLFGLLVSSSPTIICTALLLGTLLRFGQPNIPEIEEEEKTTYGLYPLQLSSSAADLLVKNDESFCMKSHVENGETVKHVENGETVKGTLVKEVNLTENRDHVDKVQSRVLLLASNVERKDETAGKSSPLKGDKNRALVENVAFEREVNNCIYFEEAKSAGNAGQVAEHVHLATSMEKETDNLKLVVHEPTVESTDSFDSSQRHVNNHDEFSDCGYQHAENTSTDASPTDNIPMLNEHHPLLGSESSQPVNTSVDNSHSVSGGSPQDCKCDGDCLKEEAEHQKETHEKKIGEPATLVTLTADDKKNLMDLGPSLLERHRRLENLIAKRRARKNPSESMNELAHSQLRISTVRRNPFDLSYDSEDEIPGSAPSFYLPRENLFDLFYDQADESCGLTGVSQGDQGSVPARRDMFFRRFESFTVGASFTSELEEQEQYIRSKPYFPTERVILEETSADFQRQLSEKSHSNGGASEPESIFSVEDVRHNELVEQELHQECNFELISACSHVKSVEKEIHSMF